MEKLINTDINLSKRIIKKPVFNNILNKDHNLHDIIVLYNDGRNWKVIPINVLLKYPIIHDLYYELSKDNTDIISDITIYMCPYTLVTSIYFGTYLPINKIYNNNLVISEDNDSLLIPIINKTYSISSKNITNKYIRRNEARIMTLLNAMTMYPDLLFIDTNTIKKIKNINKLNYLTNSEIKFSYNNHLEKYKPKTFVYVIEYKSKKNYEYKYTVIIPKNNSFDTDKNGFGQYFEKIIDKIRDKGGYIFNCFWFALDNTNKNYKTIAL
jgi:hypothetical protein